MTGRGVLLSLLLMLAGCQQSAHDASPAGPATKAAESESAVDEFEDAIHHEGVIVFRSWSGNFIGTDCDTDLRFLPDSHVEMVEYGSTMAIYRGIYQIDPRGRMTATFTGFNHPWPTMLIERDSAGLELSPVGSADFVMGNRGGATLPNDRGTYWPFRPLVVQTRAKTTE